MNASHLTQTLQTNNVRDVRIATILSRMENSKILQRRRQNGNENKREYQSGPMQR